MVITYSRQHEVKVAQNLFFTHIFGQMEVNVKQGVKKNEKITLTGPITQQKYPEELRLITYYDKQKDKIYQFLTNNFHLSLIL